MKAKFTARTRQVSMLNCLTLAVLGAIGSLAATPAIADVTSTDFTQITPATPSSWNTATIVTIGVNTGVNSSLTLDNTPTLTTISVDTTYIGNAAGATGTLTVTGTGASWTSTGTTGTTYVGGPTSGSNGLLNIDNGASLTTNSLYVADSATGTGTINVTNGSFLNALSPGSTNITIGTNNNGNLNVLSGSTFNSVGAVTIGLTATNSTVTIRNDGSTWNCGDTIFIGGLVGSGNGGNLVIDDHGTVDAGANTIYVGPTGPSSLSVTAGSHLTSGTAYVGYSSAASNGTVTIDGADTIWTNDGDIHIAALASSTGSLTVSGGAIVETQDIIAGAGSASMTFNGGTLHALSSSSNFIAGSYSSLFLDNDGLTVQVDHGQFAIISQLFTGSGGIVKTGTGSLVLNGDQLYHGLTEVREGSLAGNVSFPDNVIVRSNATLSPGNGAGNWSTRIGNDYTQESDAILVLKVGSLGSTGLAVGGTVTLNGLLALNTDGIVNAPFYVLIDNFGGATIDGTFSDITLNGLSVTLDPLAGTGGGGEFDINGIPYILTYTGVAADGSFTGGHDVLLSKVPEPASLSLLVLGAAGLFLRRRK
ncbi:MAG: PEP-CTERM sorting domain-containing protein [Phycisphaerales bacterium]|nr:PEP-CTERM sorting domain-containing protein [Phycisphaerales bacterium]